MTYELSDSGDYVVEVIDEGRTSMVGHLPSRVCRVSVSDGSLANDGSDTETVTVEVVDGLEVARGTDPSEATVLDESGEVTLRVDGSPQTVALTNGSGSLDVTTTAAAGSTIEVEAVGLADYPAESDSAEISVVSA